MGCLCRCQKPGTEAFLRSQTLAACMQQVAPGSKCPTWAGADQKEPGDHPISNQGHSHGGLLIPDTTELPYEMPPTSPLSG